MNNFNVEEAVNAAANKDFNFKVGDKVVYGFHKQIGTITEIDQKNETAWIDETTCVRFIALTKYTEEYKKEKIALKQVVSTLQERLSIMKDFEAAYSSETFSEGYMLIDFKGKRFAVKIQEMKSVPGTPIFEDINRVKYFI